MKKYVTMLLLLIMLVVTGCSNNTITEGTIIDMEYSAESSRTVINTTNGIAIPQTYANNAKWSILVKGVDIDGKDGKRWFNVTKEVFELFMIGDYYSSDIVRESLK